MFTFANHFERQPFRLPSFTAEQLMVTPPVSVNKYTTVQDATTLMRKHRLNAAPIVDGEGRPVALVELSECKRHELSMFPAFVNRGAFGTETTYASQIAIPQLYRIRVDAPGTAVINMLLQPRAQRLYVVAPSGKLSGVISRSDVLRHLLEQSIGAAAMPQAGHVALDESLPSSSMSTV